MFDVRDGRPMTTKCGQRSGRRQERGNRVASPQAEHVDQGAVHASESVKEAIALTSGSVTDISLARYRYSPAQMVRPGGSMIPHLRDNQQYISFSPRARGLTGNKANKRASGATGTTDAQRGLSACLAPKPCL